MNIRLISYIIVSTFFFTACSSDTVGSGDVNPNAIHQDYSIDYREDSHTSTLKAQFRVGGSTGTTVELEPPSALYVNGNSPHKSTFFGTSYSIAQSGIVPTAYFEFRAETGERYINSINLNTVQITANPSPIMIGANYYIPVSTFPLAAGDTLHATLQQEFVENGINRYVYLEGRYESTYSRIVFTVYDISRLRNGIAELHLSRSQRKALLDTTPRGGGEISSHYYLRPIALTVYGQSFAPNPILPL
ncbi:MAG: hypothetical protein IT287_07100 [Bdellovibrionaceae bacterium]|nr:hypothetical protein [Pseudobdellovibrionaceae bacterium]